MRRVLIIPAIIGGCSGQPYRHDCLAPDRPAQPIETDARTVTIEVPVYFTHPTDIADTNTTVTAIGSDRSIALERTVSKWEECLDGALVQQEALVSFQLVIDKDILEFTTEGYIEFPQDSASDGVAVFAYEGWRFGEEPAQITPFVPEREPGFVYEGTAYQLSVMSPSASTPTGFFDLAVDRHDNETKRTVRILTADLGPWGTR